MGAQRAPSLSLFVLGHSLTEEISKANNHLSLHRKAVHSQKILCTAARASRNVYTENLNVADDMCEELSYPIRTTFKTKYIALVLSQPSLIKCSFFESVSNAFC